MRSGDKRLTEKDIIRMQELKEQGLSYAEIGRMMKPPRHHTTVMYRLKYKPLTMRKITNICVLCKKEKSEKWKDTNYCSIKCWDADYDSPCSKYY